MIVSDFAVIVPTRGRPANAHRLANAFRDTAPDVDLFFGVDDDDPACIDYLAIEPLLRPATIITGRRRRLVGTLNTIAADLATEYHYLGFMGDDHLPVVTGWAEPVVKALDELGTGIVYGNDLIHGAMLPTAAFMTTDIIRALGWMAPPWLVHLYVDNSWLDIGRALDAVRYLPEVVIEHRHPITGTVSWDAGYLEVNSGAMQAADRAAYDLWITDGGPATAAATIREAARG